MLSEGAAAPAAAATTRRKLEHTRRTDNFLKSVGEGAIWAMDETALAACLQNSELMEKKPKDCAPLLEKMHGVDAHGRINASSVVDEALFGKSPMGGLIHTQNTQANFWMDARGGFAKR